MQESGCTVTPDNKETKLGNSDHDTFPSAGQNNGVVSWNGSVSLQLFPMV